MRQPFDEKEAAESIARHARADLHKPLSAFCGDLISYTKSADGVSKSDIDTMKARSRKLAGKPAKTVEDDPATPDIDESKQKISSAQTSYPSRTGHFSGIVETFKQLIPNPEEDRFKHDALDAMVTALHDADTNVIETASETAQARAALDAPLYTKTNNLIDGVISARNYLKSSHKSSAAYQKIKRFKFAKPKRLSGK